MLALFTIFIQSQVLAAAHDGFTSVGTAFPFSTALLKNGDCRAIVMTAAQTCLSAPSASYPLERICKGRERSLC
jgi:hypothetical protein